MSNPLNPNTTGYRPDEIPEGALLALGIPRTITGRRQEADGWWLDLADSDPAGPYPDDAVVYVLKPEPKAASVQKKRA